MERKAYLDWLRGLAVVIMVEAHVIDAWTREADRHGTPYFWAVFVAGIAAPLFLFMAGVSLALAADARAAKVGHAAAAAHARLRGWQVLALAFVFRAQSQLLGWGALSNFLKVDILNVMGVTLVLAGVLWALASARTARLWVFLAAMTAVTMTTPLVREVAWLAALPDVVEAYIRPLPARSNFVLFPWAAFLLAGVVVGDLLTAARTRAHEWRLQLGLAVAGTAGIGLGYLASFRPSIYAVANFWTSSPTFFFIRLGIATALVPFSWLLHSGPPSLAQDRAARFGEVPPKRPSAAGGGTPPGTPGTVRTAGTLLSALGVMGKSSLFVYWIHVEMVYGVTGRPLRRLLPLEASLAATAALCVLLYFIVLWKNKKMATVTLTGPWRLLAPVLK